jgi:Uma2 family endonuclease
MQQLSEGERYTYEDYLKWETGSERYELIDGIPYLMAAPSRQHQKVAGELFRQMSNFLRGKPCEVYIAPIDVRLNHNEGDDTVVQPDILVVCDKSKLDDKGIKGVPDMVVEVLSPSNTLSEMTRKQTKYLQSGVCEYWAVNLELKMVQSIVLSGGAYIYRTYGEDAEVPVAVLEDFRVSMKDVFAE